MNTDTIVSISSDELNMLVLGFIQAAGENNFRMILVGRVLYFHRVQCHWVDIDLWIDSSEENITILKKAHHQTGFKLKDFPLTAYE